MNEAEGIRIFLRIRPTVSARQGSLLSSPTNATANLPCQYEVEHSLTQSTVRLHLPRRDSNEVVNNSTEDYAYHFRRVFEPQSSQQEVFDSVARECVLSVLDGYNSTVFAYGQTGSGKTYSVTGGTDGYDERGIIPRALALIYDEVAQRKDWNWTVSLSYLQIYNGAGQDLLNHGQDARRMEDLPSVSVHEGEEEVALRGLEQHYAPTLAEALNLLFLGDTNRLYCETPMNKTSSRSHCVFAVRLEARAVGSGSATVRHSKLNLVDLAGSERVSRSGGVHGSTLTETKYINLSLHFLEHVIVALSEQARGRREHVPFRNSFLTMVLRDSLGRNCRTVMLATAHVAQGMLPETISTCQFAQRVALIKQQARVNEEVDPAVLVRRLKAEVVQLRDRLAFYEKQRPAARAADDGEDDGDDCASGEFGADRVLGEEERMLCRMMVRRFVDSKESNARLEGFEGDLARIYFCFQVLKEMVALPAASDARRRLAGDKGSDGEGAAVVEELRTRVDALQRSLQHKENELNTMLEVLHRGGDGCNGGSSAARVSAMVPRHDSPSLAASRDTPCRETRNNDDNNNNDSSSAALAHVSTLRSAGQLSEAEAIAASEFLRSKEARLAEVYNLAALTDASLLQNRARAFEAFKASYRNYDTVEQTKRDLKERYVVCKQTAQKLNCSVDEIKRLKTQVQRVRVERAVDGGGHGQRGTHNDTSGDSDAVEGALLEQLTLEKTRYNALAAELRTQKEHIDGMHAFIKRSQDQLAHDYEEWLTMRHRQIERAVGGTEGEQGGGVGGSVGGGGHDDSSIGNNTERGRCAIRGGASAHSGRDKNDNDGVRNNTRRGSGADILSERCSTSMPVPPPAAETATNPCHSSSSNHHSNNNSAPVLRQVIESLPALVKVDTWATTAMGTTTPPPPSLHNPSTLLTTSIQTRRSDSAHTHTRARPEEAAEVSWATTATLASRQMSCPAMPRQTPSLSPPRQLAPLQSSHPYSHDCTSVALGSGAAAVPQKPIHDNPGSAAQHSSLNSIDTSDKDSLSRVTAPSSAASVAWSRETRMSDQTVARRPMANPYALAHRSTGNLAADEQLAALYKVRDTMRQQFL